MVPNPLQPNSFGTTIPDLVADRCDIAMASIWLTYDRFLKFDVTNYVDYQCGTFLVPVPEAVNAALYIYLPLSTAAWIAVVFGYLTMVLLITYFSRIGVNQEHSEAFTWNPFNRNPFKIKNSVYDTLSRSFLDMFGIVTAHSLGAFPKQSSVNWLLLRFAYTFTASYSLKYTINFYSWIIISFLIATYYLTGYTSLLSRPRHRKPIDTMDEFLDNGNFWKPH